MTPSRYWRWKRRAASRRVVSKAVAESFSACSRAISARMPEALQSGKCPSYSCFPW